MRTVVATVSVFDRPQLLIVESYAPYKHGHRSWVMSKGGLR